MLHAVDCSVTLIDRKPSQIELSGRFDTKVYFGDGLRLDLLRRAGADEARLIIYCIDDASVDAAVLGPVVEAFPQAKRSEEHTSDLQSLLRNSYAVFCLK